MKIGLNDQERKLGVAISDEDFTQTVDELAVMYSNLSDEDFQAHVSALESSRETEPSSALVTNEGPRVSLSSLYRQLALPELDKHISAIKRVQVARMPKAVATGLDSQQLNSAKLTAPITVKQAYNIDSHFGDVAKTVAKSNPMKRFKWVNYSTGASNNWLFALGFSLASNSEPICCAWRYELYLQLGFWSLRIGFKPYKAVALGDLDAGEYYPDEANERY